MSEPDLIRDNGNKEWWGLNENGADVLHREDGPAIIHFDGAQEWYQNGKHYRIDGPALLLTDGTEMWAQGHGLNRDDGPAISYPDGQKEWYKHGKRHRLDGPALIKKDYNAWFVEGVRANSNEHFQNMSGVPDIDMLRLVLKYGDVE